VLHVSSMSSVLVASRSEAITVMIHNRFDYENKLFYSSHTEHISPMSELVKIYDDEQMVERMFITGREFQKLGLTASEMLLTLSIIITFPGRLQLHVTQGFIHYLIYTSTVYSLTHSLTHSANSLTHSLC